MFADNLIFFIKITNTTCQAINDIFCQFERMLGLVINQLKSEVWFNPSIPKTKRIEFADKVGIKWVKQFGKYLGNILIGLPGGRILEKNL